MIDRMGEYAYFPPTMIKGIQKQLQKIRDNVVEEGRLSEADTEMLKRILEDMRPAGNDNAPLTDEQMRKLSIVEKTGTGSKYVH